MDRVHPLPLHQKVKLFLLTCLQAISNGSTISNTAASGSASPSVCYTTCLPTPSIADLDWKSNPRTCNTLLNGNQWSGDSYDSWKPKLLSLTDFRRYEKNDRAFCESDVAFKNYGSFSTIHGPTVHPYSTISMEPSTFTELVPQHEWNCSNTVLYTSRNSQC